MLYVYLSIVVYIYIYMCVCATVCLWQSHLKAVQHALPPRRQSQRGWPADPRSQQISHKSTSGSSQKAKVSRATGSLESGELGTSDMPNLSLAGPSFRPKCHAHLFVTARRGWRGYLTRSFSHAIMLKNQPSRLYLSYEEEEKIRRCEHFVPK